MWEWGNLIIIKHGERERECWTCWGVCGMCVSWKHWQGQMSEMRNVSQLYDDKSLS